MSVVGGPSKHTALGSAVKSTVFEELMQNQVGERTIEGLQSLVEQYASKEDAFKKLHAELDVRIKSLYDEVVEAKAERAKGSKGGALAASLVATRAADQQLKIKEKLLVRLRMIEDKHNRDLSIMKNRINQLRIESVDQNHRFDEMVSELQGVKAQLVAQLEVSNGILADRNDLSDHLKAVRSEDAEHKKQFEAKLKELNEQIDVVQASLVKAARHGKLGSGGGGGGGGDDGGGAEGEGGPGSGNLTEEQEEEARANINKLDHLIKEYEAIVTDLHSQTHQLQEVFKHMIAQVGLERLDQLVERFAEEEAFKYEIFGYVAHTNSETKSYEELLRDVKVNQAAYIRDLAAQARQQTEHVNGMKKEVASLRGQVEAFHGRKREIHGVVARVLQQLIRVYAAMGGRDPSRLSLVTEQATRERQARIAAAQQQQQQQQRQHDGGDSKNEDGDSLALSSPVAGTLSTSRSDASGATRILGGAAGPNREGGGSGAAGDDLPTLVISRDDAVAVMGDLEQMTSDLAMSFVAVAKSAGATQFMLEGVRGLQHAVQQEVGRLVAQESSAMQQRQQQQHGYQQDAASDNTDGYDSPSSGGASAARPSAFTPAGRARYLDLVGYQAEYEAISDALASITPEAAEAMMKSMHRQPVVPAKAVAAGLRMSVAGDPVLQLASQVERLSLAPVPKDEDGAGGRAGRRGKQKKKKQHVRHGDGHHGGGGSDSKRASPPPQAGNGAIYHGGSSATPLGIRAAPSPTASSSSSIFMTAAAGASSPVRAPAQQPPVKQTPGMQLMQQSQQQQQPVAPLQPPSARAGAAAGIAAMASATPGGGRGRPTADPTRDTRFLQPELIPLGKPSLASANIMMQASPRQPRVSGGGGGGGPIPSLQVITEGNLTGRSLGSPYQTSQMLPPGDGRQQQRHSSTTARDGGGGLVMQRL